MPDDRTVSSVLGVVGMCSSVLLVAATLMILMSGNILGMVSCCVVWSSLIYSILHPYVFWLLGASFGLLFSKKS